VRHVRDTLPTSIDEVTDLDVILPAQLYRDVRALDEPEYRLRLAILKDAVRYVQRYAGATDPPGQALYADALDWFFDPDRSEPFGFENVCEALGLDPSYVRRGLRRWLARVDVDRDDGRGGITRHAA
jgi:hypothetical protein